MNGYNVRCVYFISPFLLFAALALGCTIVLLPVSPAGIATTDVDNETRMAAWEN